MASVIDIASTEPAAPPAELPAQSVGTPADGGPPAGGPHAAAATGDPARRCRRRRFRRPRISPLTRRIIAVNVLPLAVLAGGFLYLGKFELSLIGQQVEALRTQGEIFAAALGEGAVLESPDDGEVLLPDLARQMMRRLVAPTRTPARLFDREGKIVADSRALGGPGDLVQVAELPPPDNKSWTTRAGDHIYDWIVGLLPRRGNYPAYRDHPTADGLSRGDAGAAWRGRRGGAARPGRQGARHQRRGARAAL